MGPSHLIEPQAVTDLTGSFKDGQKALPIARPIGALAIRATRFRRRTLSAAFLQRVGR